jgi:cystathionine gamma-synthase
MTAKKPATISAQAGIGKDIHHGAVVQPLHLSSTYSLKGFNSKREYDYSRTGNPTRSTLGETIAALENGNCGIVTSTGLAAVHLICQLLSTDDLVVIPHDCYGGSYRLFTHLAERGLFKLKVIDQGNNEQLDQALALKPRLVLIETPSNPLLRVVDIKEISKKAHEVDALVAVDNTFLTPLWQKPLDLGADIVIHSTTKYLNGHSDIVGGALVTKDPQLGEELAWWANCIGITGSAFDSYLAIRGIKTLPVRLAQHQRNTEQVVKFLQSHPAIAKVYYPGLSEHPDHQLASRQQQAFGAMVSFELAGGVESVKALFANLRIFSLAQSLGGVESLISHPSTMTHAGMELEAQLKAGISQSLVRLSVGIEDVEDLLADLNNGLDASIHVNAEGDERVANAADNANQSADDAEQNFSPSNLSPALAALW